MVLTNVIIQCVRVFRPIRLLPRAKVAIGSGRWHTLDTSDLEEIARALRLRPPGDRAHYVAPESIRAILAVCPDDQWRAIIALSRYAGLRCPSEVGLMRWGDVNWERGRLTVRSPKTAGHEGHAVRVVPIAPELRPILLALFDQAEPGTECIVPRLRDPRTNLRTTFEKIIAPGVKPWPRLFQNMRASCATDWVERFPAHVVAGWLGHSPMIAAQHYLQVRDAHFDLAAGGAESGALEAQNSAQHPSAPDRASSHDESEIPCVAGFTHTGANERDAAQSEQRGPVGFEPTLPLPGRGF